MGTHLLTQYVRHVHGQCAGASPTLILHSADPAGNPWRTCLLLSVFPKIVLPANQTIKMVLREAQRGKTLCIKLHVAAVNVCMMYREDPKRGGQSPGDKNSRGPPGATEVNSLTPFVQEKVEHLPLVRH